MNAKQSTAPRIAVIGAGMSGLLAGIKLVEAGYDNFTIYEKADRVGGTWRDNTYPGLTCDVPSQHYCYSFALNPEWSHLFSPGPEIQGYFEGISERYALAPYLRLGKELQRAAWQGEQWALTFADGEAVECDVVIMATGVLHHPIWPEIPGVGSFDGPQFHTARWDHDVPLEGKRVGIIGTGSTAIQITPAVIDRVGSLSLFQRTPQWILPIPNPAYSDEEKAQFRAEPELLADSYHAFSERIRTTIARAVVGDAEQMQKIADACRRNLEDNVHDPELRARLTPDYAVACKRLIMSENFYAAIQRDNAELVTTSIQAIEARGIRTTDGRLHELDVLVYATGFDAHRFIRGVQISGLNGVTVDEAWKDGLYAHRSMSLPGFPNLFMMIGPNSPIGNFSLIMVAEEQIRYILALVEEIRQGRCTRLQPREEACAAFNAAVRGAMGNTVWVSGCRSWYLDKNGQPILWPWGLERFLEDMRAPDLSEYVLAG